MSDAASQMLDLPSLQQRIDKCAARLQHVQGMACRCERVNLSMFAGASTCCPPHADAALCSRRGAVVVICVGLLDSLDGLAKHPSSELGKSGGLALSQKVPVNVRVCGAAHVKIDSVSYIFI